MAFVVLFLSVQPAFALLQKKETAECCNSCTSDTDTQKKDQPAKENSENSDCNPLQSCGKSICGFTTSFSSFNIKEPVVYTNHFISFSDIFRSEFSSDFWHPPKFL
jgi:hypothetical protein